MRLLFICTGNIQRSPTFEAWFKKYRCQYEVRSTGTAYGYPYRLTAELLEWADIIYLMDLEQEMFLARKFPEYIPKTKIIGCSDQYAPESPELDNLIRYWIRKEGL